MNTNAPDTEVAADLKSKETPGNSRRQRQPSLLDSLLVAPDQNQNATDAGFGILCNDPTGLCLSATGSFVVKDKAKPILANMDDAVVSGVYTSLTKLAQQLHPDNAPASAAPLITIETEDSNLLIKEYDGHAIALKVPALRAAKGGGSTNENQSHANEAPNVGTS